MLSDHPDVVLIGPKGSIVLIPALPRQTVFFLVIWGDKSNKPPFFPKNPTKSLEGWDIFPNLADEIANVVEKVSIMVEAISIMVERVSIMVEMVSIMVEMISTR
jgi:hypothetical protein